MTIALPFACPLELQAQYGSMDISAALGLATLDRSGQTGVGVLHAPELNAYAMLITVQKTEREFSPSTMYADYPISRELFHWESQSTPAKRAPQDRTSSGTSIGATRSYCLPGT